MKILVGVQPDAQGDDAIACGEALARAMRADLVLAHVHPTPWRTHSESATESAVDAEWRAYLVEQAKATLGRSVNRLARDVTHELRVHPHTSSGRGLIEVAEEVAASIIVIGSAPGGHFEHLEGGSTSGQLLHGATVQEALEWQARFRAVLHPAHSDALYFVATGLGDGSHHFSATYAEHKEALQNFLRRTGAVPGGAR